MCNHQNLLTLVKILKLVKILTLVKIVATVMKMIKNDLNIIKIKTFLNKYINRYVLVMRCG